MVWTVKWTDRAFKASKKLAPSVQEAIIRFLHDRVATADNPRRFGHGLMGDRSGLWRYRVGDFRVICRIEDECVVVLVVDVGHRREIYR
ncbi:mRNA interferase RelE/StbE [Azospirillaceae bacterium]